MFAIVQKSNEKLLSDDSNQLHLHRYRNILYL